MRQGSWVQIYSGERFWPLDPRPEEIHITDIAHALSLLCRYNGHVERFYSVAEHCVLLSTAVEDQNQMWALMHDAAEAYIGDMTRPLKRHMQAFRISEGRILRCISERFGLHPMIPNEVLEADTRILLTERKALMRNTHHNWEIEHYTPLPVEIQAWPPAEAEINFLARWKELGGRHEE